MAPAKANKPEIQPWAWVVTVSPENVELEHMLKAYRVLDFKPCDDPR